MTTQSALPKSTSPAPSRKVSDIRILDKREKEHLYHPDFSPDGLYVTYSVGPGGRTAASGPGTHTEVAEMVGIRGDWQIHLKRVSGEGPSVELKNPEFETNKESDWLPVFSSGVAPTQ